MRLLLDTHIWLWHELEPASLPTWAATALASARNQLWVSPVSVWELLLLTEKGRVVLDRELPRWLDLCFETNGYLQAQFSNAVAVAAGQVQLAHRDPADRLLAATARHYDLALVTADQRLQDGRGFPLYRPA